MKLAILGSPVRHSLSPAMHRAALQQIGRDGQYEAYDVDHDGFLRSVADIRRGVISGANVTMPYKRLAFELCDEVSPTAGRAGAVNTLFMRSGRLHGANTDVRGVEYAWEVGGLPVEGPVIILGAGGASAAAQVALQSRRLVVKARRPEAARQVVAAIGSGAAVASWDDPMPPGTVVNATSIGMRGELLPEQVLAAATGLLDMVYGDAPTRSVVRLRHASRPVADGLDMLVGQAAASFAIWTGEEVPPMVFRKAAEQELLKRAG